jgi:DNA-binding NarL/FixJ family response regulator
MYYKNSLDFDICSVDFSKWTRQTVKPLNDRQRFMLLYIRRGKMDKDIADMLHISIKAYDAEKTRLFKNIGLTKSAG